MDKEKPKAFISCSLEGADKEFNEKIINLVHSFGLEPFGTVGKYDQAPEPLKETMDKNISSADCLVAIFTPRYNISDHNNNIIGQKISDSIFYEVSVAVSMGKPVILFTQEKILVPDVFKGTTQYIELRKDGSNIDEKMPLIKSIFENAVKKIEDTKKKKEIDIEKFGSTLGFRLYKSDNIFNTGTADCWKHGYFKIEDVNSDYDVIRKEAEDICQKLKNITPIKKGIIIFGEGFSGKSVLIYRIIINLLKDYFILFSYNLTGSETDITIFLNNLAKTYPQILVIVDDVHLSNNEIIFSIMNSNTYPNIIFLFAGREKSFRKLMPETRRSMSSLHEVFLQFDEQYALALFSKAASFFLKHIKSTHYELFSTRFYKLSNGDPYSYNAVLRSILSSDQPKQDSIKWHHKDLYDIILDDVRFNIDLCGQDKRLWDGFLLISFLGMFELTLETHKTDILKCTGIIPFHLGELVTKELIKMDQGGYKDFHPLRSTNLIIHLFHDRYGDDIQSFNKDYNFLKILKCLSENLSKSDIITILRRCGDMDNSSRTRILSKYITENIIKEPNEYRDNNKHDVALILSYGIGDYYSKTGNLKEAIKYYDKSIEIDPDNPQLYIHKQVKYIDFKEFQLALEECEKCIKKFPDIQDTYYNKGVALYSLGRYPDAISIFEYYIKLDPSDVDAINNLGRAYMGIGNLNKALECFESAIEIDNEYTHAISNIAYMNFLFNRLYDSLDYSERALKINPSLHQTWFVKSLVLRQLEKNEESLDALNRALEYDHKNSTYWYRKGIILHILNRDNEAIRAYDKSLELKPNVVEVISDKGNAYLTIGEINTALELFDKAISINPNDPIMWYNKSAAYYNLGQYKKAILNASKATGLAPNYITAWRIKMTSYMELNDFVNANTIAQKMSKIENTKPFESTYVEKFDFNRMLI